MREGCSVWEVGSSSAPGGPARKRAHGTLECPNCTFWDNDKETIERRLGGTVDGEPRCLTCADAHRCMYHVVDTHITWRPDEHTSKEGFQPQDAVPRVAYNSDEEVVSQTDSAPSDELSWDS